MMGMPVKYHIDAVAVDRLLKATTAEEGEDFRRFAFHRVVYRRVMQQGHPLAGSESSQRRFQLERLVHRFTHERLDRCFAPGLQDPGAKAARKTFDPGETNTVYLAGIAI